MIIEALNPKKHNRKEFDCGEESLNLYLAKFAKQDQKRDLSRTFALVEDKTIVGYYSISSHSVSRAFLPDTIKVGGYEDIPFVLLGRLAVDKNYQGRGFGDLLIFDVFKKISDLANSIGIFGVIVDSLTEKSTSYYEGFGFQKLSSNRQRLFLPMAVISELLKKL